MKQEVQELKCIMILSAITTNVLKKITVLNMNILQDLERYADLIPYRTEWMVYHEELRLAGSIDMIYRNPDGSLLIYDWKRSKAIEKIPRFNKYAKTECINHLPDTNYWHYCLQLNVYRAILEEKYGEKVVGMYLVCLHPNNKNKSFQRIEVVDLSDEVKQLFSFRKTAVDAR